MTYTGLSFQGTVKAGTHPVVSASVQLYAAGAAGNGSSAAALLANPVPSSADGTFTIPAAYSCPSSAALVYLVATGGAVGGANNANLALMTALGSCGDLTASTQVVLNEVTTAAAIYALGPFYSAGGMVGASATNTTGLANAFATAATLANPATGTAPGATLPANVVAAASLVDGSTTSRPEQRINSIANFLNTCTAKASGCSALYTAAAGASGASNTLDALFALTRHPANNTTALYALAAANPVFSPALTTAPADYTVFLTIGGGGLNQPTGLGLDSTGSVWVANYPGGLSRFKPSGAPVFASGLTGGGLFLSYGLAVDLNDNAWVPNEPGSGGGGSVSEFSTAGMSLAGAGGYTQGGIDYPIPVAIDPNGTVWVGNNGDSSVTLLNSSGMPLSGASGYISASLEFPVALAIDGNHYGWVGNQSDVTVTRVAPDGSSFTTFACCNSPAGIAIDQGNNVWVSNFKGASVSLLANSGTVLSNGGYTGLGAADHPQGIAVDGAGTVWVANYRQPYLLELAGSGTSAPGASLSPSTGLGADSQMLLAFALAIDASGNVWVSSEGTSTITKFVGLATPVKTPLSGLPKLP